MPRDFKLCGGCRHLSHSNGTRMYEATDSMVWETGYWKQLSSENGVIRKMV